MNQPCTYVGKVGEIVNGRIGARAAGTMWSNHLHRLEQAAALGVQSRSEVGWIVSESPRLVCPSFADVLVGSEPPQGLEALSEDGGSRSDSAERWLP